MQHVLLIFDENWSAGKCDQYPPPYLNCFFNLTCHKQNKHVSVATYVSHMFCCYYTGDSYQWDFFYPKQIHRKSMGLFVSPLLRELSSNKNTSLLVFLRVNQLPKWNLFMLQVNKAASNLIEPWFCKYTDVAQQWVGGGEQRGDLAVPNQSLTDYC